MSQSIYKILYCSRNLIQGAPEQQEAEIRQILETARANNGREGVTGALLFNEGTFAQVLEGPQAAIERIFERIQRDPRHSDVIVLKTAAEEERDFPAWSMAHVQPPSAAQSAGMTAALDMAKVDPAAAGNEVVGLLRSLVIQED